MMIYEVLAHSRKIDSRIDVGLGDRAETELPGAAPEGRLLHDVLHSRLIRRC